MKKTKKQIIRIVPSKRNDKGCKFLVMAEYSGFSPAFDAVLDKCVGKSHGGSGFGLGRRDVSWAFKTIACARKAADKLNKIEGVTTSIDEV
jgi:hypothetical protein